MIWNVEVQATGRRIYEVEADNEKDAIAKSAETLSVVPATKREQFR